MGFFGKKKQKGVVSTTEYSPYTPDSPEFSKANRNSGYSSLTLTSLEKKDAKYKERIRILRLISRCLSLILNGFMIGSLTYTLISYFTTRNKTMDGVRIWGDPKLLWPTFLILSISTLTFILNVATITAYLCSIKAANKTGDFTIFSGYVMLGIEFIAWAVSSVLYKMNDTGADLWGYSCGEKAPEQFLAQAKSFVDFGMLCNAQTGTWFSTIIQATLYLLTLVTLFLVYRRAKGQKRVQSFRETELLENEHLSHGSKSGKKYMPVSGSPSNF